MSFLPCSLSARWKSVKSTVPLPAGGAAGKKEGGGAEKDEEQEEEEEDVVPIVICSSEERMGATMAAVNSVHSNTDARLFFYIVTLRDAVKLTRLLIHPHLNLNVQCVIEYLEILKKKQRHQMVTF